MLTLEKDARGLLDRRRRHRPSASWSMDNSRINLNRGQRFDAATGLQSNLNRWYDPSVGRWLGQDPISFDGGDDNLYGYCDNGPTDGTDASGLRPKSGDDAVVSGSGKNEYYARAVGYVITSGNSPEALKGAESVIESAETLEKLESLSNLVQEQVWRDWVGAQKLFDAVSEEVATAVEHVNNVRMKPPYSASVDDYRWGGRPDAFRPRTK